MSVNIETTTGDLFGFVAESLDERVTQYVSGAQSTPAYLNGVMSAGLPLCVTACNLSQPSLEALEAYVQRPGARLLVDSGAFMYRAKPSDMPWWRVVATYRRLAQCCNASSRIDFVLPDVVGDQAATIEVLAEWGQACIEAVGDSRRFLLTIQDGELSPAAFVRNSEQALGVTIWGVALPCKVARLPASKLHCLNSLSLDRVHLLGASRGGQVVRERVVALSHALPSAEVSCDSTSFRAQIGEGKPITEMRRDYQRKKLVNSGELYAELAADPDLRRELVALMQEKNPTLGALLIEDVDEEMWIDSIEWLWGCEDLLIDCYLELTGSVLGDDSESTRNAVADWAFELSGLSAPAMDASQLEAATTFESMETQIAVSALRAT